MDFPVSPPCSAEIPQKHGSAFYCYSKITSVPLGWRGSVGQSAVMEGQTFFDRGCDRKLNPERPMLKAWTQRYGATLDGGGRPRKDSNSSTVLSMDRPGRGSWSAQPTTGGGFGCRQAGDWMRAVFIPFQRTDGWMGRKRKKAATRTGMQGKDCQIVRVGTMIGHAWVLKLSPKTGTTEGPYYGA